MVVFFSGNNNVSNKIIKCKIIYNNEYSSKFIIKNL